MWVKNKFVANLTDKEIAYDLAHTSHIRFTNCIPSGLECNRENIYCACLFVDSANEKKMIQTGAAIEPHE